MTATTLAGRIARFMGVPADNPELLKAQYRAFSRQLPMMYFILISSTWAVAITYRAITPAWLTVWIPLLLTLACAIRVLHWWPSRRIVPTPELALRALKRTNRLASIMAVSFTAWSLALFHHGDPYTRSYLAFYMAITVIACIFCLMHLRSAAITVTVIVNGAFIAFFASTGQPTFIAIAINMALVSVGLLVILMVNYRDFTAMVNAQTEARRREEEQGRLLHMIDDMPVAVMTVEPDTFAINYVNNTSRRLIDRIAHLLPIDADTLLGTSIDVFHTHPEHQRRLLADPANLPHNARIRLGPEVLDLKVSAVRANDGSYIGPMLTWALVTKEVEAENRIRQLAHYDTLTGLANRTNFREQLDARLEVPGARLGLLYIDLDGFKLVNDTKGHRAGDALLERVAQRLRAVCDCPGVAIARLGGDEFAVLVPHDDADRAAALAAELIEALGVPSPLGADPSVRIGASIGIALAPAHGRDTENLLARADIALYAAKAAGKGLARLFCAEMETRIQARARLEAQLRTALERQDRLFVFYQPIVDVETGKITAREALVRWHHAERGWVPPDEFVPIAEQSGLIDPLGRFVLHRACREATRWEDGARVAVNVSPMQLGKGTLAQTVRAALVDSGLAPDRLEIEVTETALIQNEAESFGDLRQLYDMGVRVALDDFGTGYSSLAHLRAFPFDKIKIDRSFVRDLLERPDSAVLVKAIADLGRQLGVTTVAEGVETPAHVRRIREAGCTEAQGYFYGRPAPSDEDRPRVDACSPAPTATVPASCAG
ncbi:putative bifunctional diguanylate cyclase/phosphodiesterase [Ralstonia solanacearum]|uniref:putative bifunctional diguanylate cyclase/phosphodiesterase n=1 Tax=Ralstonia solanacearum TaxID=305 RepID=UPI000181730A|nr:EAL domain-containing protein [Ralstonia solanacearum]MDC6178209.1 EAL domain-containing protein [Ralstonia solanacearum]MDC6210672.1 EAL domain-containing protein [Ralstonia solanacearum]MDC6239076.1 EAL domain-containing protein [Ralstonia solanacearum]MDD7801020.1 EAL domain-containing protein [Ralstonia solanacearum]